MSNEYKDWIYDTLQEVALNSQLVDKIINIYPSKMGVSYINGYKGDESVTLVIWYDGINKVWNCEKTVM